jgi:glutamate dehydrogenase (NAD(P)+)
MKDIFELADDLGPLKVIHVHEPGIGLRGVLVVDNVALGPSIGGVRMASDVTVEECARLARAMTLKNAAAGLSHGGGKSVLVGNPKMPRAQKETLLRGFACALREVEQYIFGPDMGTDEECMGWIRDEIGRAVGLPRALGGIPLDEIGATGYGLAQAVDVAQEFCQLQTGGARFAVQGFGAVGKHAARFLCEAGAVAVAVSDSAGTISNPDGLDIEVLIALKSEGGSVTEYDDGEVGERDAIIDVDCDIWIPAARPDVINEGNVERLNTRLVVQGANIPITAGAEKRLHERGILSIPDFIANAGGVICAAVEYQGGSEAAAFATIEDKLRRNTREVLQSAQSEGIPPREAALSMARQRVEKAMSFRRWHIF